MDDIAYGIESHQRQAEWLFAAAVYNNPLEAKNTAGWLEPDWIKEPKVRRFWEKIRAGEDAPKAAMDEGIFLELTKYMTGLTFSTTYMPSFAATIADDIYLRKVADSLGYLAGLVAERRTDEVQLAIERIAKDRPFGEITGQQAVEASLDFMDSIDDQPNVIKTGIQKLDSGFGGFSRQSLSILGARPSMGKTALALQFARGCVDQGGICLYFSVEMSRKALWSRMVCGDALVDHRRYKSRTWSWDERDRCIKVNNDLVAKYGERLIIDERSHVTSSDIWRSVAQYKPDLLVVDHLSLVADEGENNVLRVGKIAWAGKQIAKEHDCASLYLCQLNRGVEAREDKVPTMSDLRDSGEIEQDADIIMFIHRDDYYQQTSNPNRISPTQLVVAKDREGARNVGYKLEYDLLAQSFREAPLPPAQREQQHTGAFSKREEAYGWK